MFAWNKGVRRGTMASHDQNGEAMSTEDFIRESFAEARREQVPNGHELFEHLKDEPLSDEDAVGVTFGNRQTLQRLYDDGKVKPEGDAAFREALGLPPRSQDPLAGARLLAAHGGQDATAPGAIAFGGAQSSSPAPDPWKKLPPDPAKVWDFAKTAAQGAGSAVSRAGQELMNNEALHAGPGNAVAGAARAITGNRDIVQKPVEAVRAAGREVATNRNLREQPVEAVKRGAQEVMTNEKLHRGVKAGGEMVGRVAVDVGTELRDQLVANAGPVAAEQFLQQFPLVNKIISQGVKTEADAETVRNLWDIYKNGAPRYAKRSRELGNDLTAIARKYGL